MKHGNWYHLGTFADFCKVNLIQFHPGEPQDLAYALLAYVPNFTQGKVGMLLQKHGIAGVQEIGFL